MRRLAPLWLVLILAATAAGQIRTDPTPAGIVIPAESEPFAPIEATYRVPDSIPAGASIQPEWSVPDGVEVREPIEGVLYVWAPPGTHTLRVVLDWVHIDWDARTFTRGRPELSASFTVRGPPVVDPDPDDTPDAPDTPDKPDPTVRENQWVILLTPNPNRHEDLKTAVEKLTPEVGLTIDLPDNRPGYKRLVPSGKSYPYALLILAPPGEATRLVECDEYQGVDQVINWLGEAPTTDVDQIAYVHEQRDGPVPVEVMGAIKEINAAGKIAAVTIEDDEPDLGEWQAARDAAVAAGLPALVLIRDGEVLRAVKVETFDDVMEAVK